MKERKIGMTETTQSVTGEKKPINKWMVLAAIMVGSLLTPLDSSVVNTVLPTITTYFHTGISIVQWVPTVYLLGICCLIMLYGRLGDIIGHKKVFLYGLVTFTLSSVLCGFSQNIWMLISFRMLQGLSAGMIMAVGFALVVAAFPAKERGKALGIYATGVGIAMAAGPTIGGLVAEHLGWRYIFFINVPIGITALLWCSMIIPRSNTKPGQRLDFPGAVTFSIFLPTLLLYLNRGNEWGWASPMPLTLLTISVVFGLLFLWIEQHSRQPMLSLGIFANRVFSFSMLSNFLYFLAFSAFTFLTPFFLKFVLNYSVSKVGLVMFVSPLAMLIVAPFVGTLSDRFGSRIFAIAGMCIAAFALFLLSDLKESATAFDVSWRLGLAAFGGAVFSTPNNSTVMGSVPPQHTGIASGLLAAMRNIGMVFGIAIVGAILYSLAPISTSKKGGSFSPAEIEEFMHGLRWAYLAGAAFAATSALTSILVIKRHPKD